MERRSGFWKFGKVLGHVPTASSNARKHNKFLSKEAIFGGEEEEELLRIGSLDLEQKELEKTAFGRRTREDESSHEQGSSIKTMNPVGSWWDLQVCH